ncbi:response regulator transcription factor [Microvirga terrae]|uniref:Response regulator transcription factor n=1 Tax=Microvirga terrae TaxID=2740529 RepID=A0ABY5RLT1_9HYPH|nr:MULTISPECIES: response regulator transcription factor [Microvirga]MBQ0823845.1 response regulator transcription factor [Microvirga sp. HBU67558]UVF17938.1 response regulator transcription factor [Microvirga terrae]
MIERLRVAVVDDHSMLRAGVIRALMLDDMIEVVGEGASAADAIELARVHRPDLILLDISMPGDGIEAARTISDLPASPQIVMLTASENDDAVTRALEAGAVGYLLKGINAPDLINAVKTVKTDGSFISPNLALRLLSNRIRAEARPFSTLSESEERTLRLIAAGLTNREISDRLAVTEKTVKFHVGNILKKLNVRNRVEAALLAKQEWGEA